MGKVLSSRVVASVPELAAKWTKTGI